ncbi:MAG: ArsR family transcriptional regulator [Anaerolineaceae bacterium]
MKKYSTRKKILELLSNHPTLTVLELSQLLKLTKADIRYQLKGMQEEGLVSKNEPAETHAGAGRPAASFSLSSGNLPPIVARFLEGIGDLLDHPDLDTEMREKILDSFIESIASNFHPRSSGSARMNEIVGYLSKLGFSARWEAGSSGPKIILYNNPAAFYLNHPLIRYDGTEKLIRKLMETRA